MRFSSITVNYFFLYHVLGCPVNVNGADIPSTLPPTSTRKANTLTPTSSPNRGTRPRHNQDNSGISGDGSGDGSGSGGGGGSGGILGDRNNSEDGAGGGNGSDNNGGNGSDDNNNDEIPLGMDNDESAVGK
jgi:hypothetical protein